MNYHFPYPFESVIVENVDNSRRVEIGYRSGGASRGRSGSKLTFISSENTMLTGDQNIVFITCDVMWHINSLQNYVFNVILPEEAVRAVSQSALREIVGNTPIASVLSDKKEQIADDVENLIQKTLDSYNIGVEIENVQLLKAEPPAEVIDSYRDVQTARADKERKSIKPRHIIMISCRALEVRRPKLLKRLKDISKRESQKLKVMQNDFLPYTRSI